MKKKFEALDIDQLIDSYIQNNYKNDVVLVVSIGTYYEDYINDDDINVFEEFKKLKNILGLTEDITVSFPGNEDDEADENSLYSSYLFVICNEEEAHRILDEYDSKPIYIVMYQNGEIVSENT